MASKAEKDRAAAEERAAKEAAERATREAAEKAAKEAAERATREAAEKAAKEAAAREAADKAATWGRRKTYRVKPHNCVVHHDGHKETEAKAGTHIQLTEVEAAAMPWAVELVEDEGK